MKGTIQSTYWSKNGNQVFVYSVTGTTKEKETFQLAQMESMGVDNPDDLPGAKEGLILYFATENNRFKATAQINLEVTLNNKIVVNNLAEQIKRREEIEKVKMLELAKLEAQIELGLLTIPGGESRAKLAKAQQVAKKDIKSTGTQLDDILNDEVNASVNETLASE